MLPLPLLLLLGAGAFFVIRSRSAASEAGPTGSDTGSGAPGATGATGTGMIGFGAAEGAPDLTRTPGDRSAPGVTDGGAWADVKLGESTYVDAATVVGACKAEAAALVDVPYMFTDETSKKGLIIGDDVTKLLTTPSLQTADSFKYTLFVLADELKKRLAKDPAYISSPKSYVAKPGSPEARIASLTKCLTSLAAAKFPPVACQDAADALGTSTFAATADMTKRGMSIRDAALGVLKTSVASNVAGYKNMLFLLSDELSKRLLTNPMYLLSPATYVPPADTVEGKLTALIGCMTSRVTAAFPSVGVIKFKPGTVIKSDSLGGLGVGGLGA